MEKEKKTFDLMNFGHALGREEMRKLMAGSGGGCGESCAGGCSGNCDTCCNVPSHGFLCVSSCC